MYKTEQNTPLSILGCIVGVTILVHLGEAFGGCCWQQNTFMTLPPAYTHSEEMGELMHR